LANTVLALDDDPRVLDAIERLLRSCGFEVATFSSADDFRRHANISDAACLVLDINLDGESGIEFRRELAASGASLPVIFITADTSDCIRKAAHDAGCIAYLTKPFAAQSLVDAIARASASEGSGLPS
jgi:FixJ family two-component response regulator